MKLKIFLLCFLLGNGKFVETGLKDGEKIAPLSIEEYFAILTDYNKNNASLALFLIASEANVEIIEWGVNDIPIIMVNYDYLEELRKLQNCGNDHYAIMEKLYWLGVGTNLPNLTNMQDVHSRKCVLLMFACSDEGDTALKLIHMGGNINKKFNGATCLMMARQHNSQLVPFLLEHGAIDE